MNVVSYKKKPVIIQAVELVKGGTQMACEWCGGTVVYDVKDKSVDGIKIKTLEGDHKANFGDFIIKGVAGEFYPCKPDIFWQTYEVA